MIHRYILAGLNHRAMPIASSLSLVDLQKLINAQSECMWDDTPASLVWRYGTEKFLDPEVMTPEDFVNHCPALIVVE